MILCLLNERTGKDLANGNHFIPGTAPTPVVRPHGRSLSFSTSKLQSTRTITMPPLLTVFAWVRPSVLNTSYKRIIDANYTAGFYLGSNSGSKYDWIVNNSSLEGCVGGQQVAGQRDFLCGTSDGATRILYVNGVQVASNTCTYLAFTQTVYIGSNPTGGESWTGDIDTFGIFPRVFSAAEVWALYQDPWRLVRAPDRRIVVGITPPAGGSKIPVFLNHYRSQGIM